MHHAGCSQAAQLSPAKPSAGCELPPRLHRPGRARWCRGYYCSRLVPGDPAASIWRVDIGYKVRIAESPRAWMQHTSTCQAPSSSVQIHKASLWLQQSKRQSRKVVLRWMGRDPCGGCKAPPWPLSEQLQTWRWSCSAAMGWVRFVLRRRPGRTLPGHCRLQQGITMLQPLPSRPPGPGRTCSRCLEACLVALIDDLDDRQLLPVMRGPTAAQSVPWACACTATPAAADVTHHQRGCLQARKQQAQHSPNGCLLAASPASGPQGTAQRLLGLNHAPCRRPDHPHPSAAPGRPIAAAGQPRRPASPEGMPLGADAAQSAIQAQPVPHRGAAAAPAGPRLSAPASSPVQPRRGPVPALPSPHGLPERPAPAEVRLRHLISAVPQATLRWPTMRCMTGGGDETMQCAA